jgi:hypothetical protein
MAELLTTILTCPPRSGPAFPRWEVSLVDGDDPNEHRHVLVQDERSGIGFVGSVTSLSAFADSLMRSAAIGADMILHDNDEEVAHQ